MGAGRGLVLVAVCMCVLASVVSSSESVVKKRSFRVQGRVYCDTCRAGFETNVTYYIQGAKVRVECKDRNSLQKVMSVEGVTDSSGTYNIEIQNDREDEICESVLISSPVGDCKTHDKGRSRASVVLTRSQNAVLTPIHYANSMGCLQDVALPVCQQLLKYYFSDL